MTQAQKESGRFARSLIFKGKSPPYVEQALNFLATIWEGCGGHGFIGTRNRRSGKWTEHPIILSRGLRDARKVLEQNSRVDFDLYFSVCTFSAPRRKKDHALRTRWGWCDIDAADPKKFHPRSSILLRTSPGRYQGLWLWDKWVAPTRAERYSHALTYRFGGDPGGWSITKYLRLPYSYNHKPQYSRPLVRVLHKSLAPLADRPELVAGVTLGKTDRELALGKAASDLDHTKHNPVAVVAKYKRRLHAKTVVLLTCRRMIERDRSKQIYMIVADLFSAGAEIDEIAGCVWASPYFRHKYGNNTSKLHEEVLRITSKLDR